MNIDITKSAESNLLALINASVGTSFTLDDVDFTELSVRDDDANNTMIAVSAAEVSLYYGMAYILYDRLDINLLKSESAPATDIYTVEEGNTLADVKTWLCGKYGIKESEVAFPEGATIPTEDEVANDNDLLQLQAASESLLYIGTLGVEFEYPTEELNSAVTETSMDGFDDPNQRQMPPR